MEEYVVTPLVVFILWMALSTTVMWATGLIDLDIIETEKKIALGKAFADYIRFSVLKIEVHRIPVKIAKINRMINELNEPPKTYYGTYFDNLFYLVLMLIVFTLLFFIIIAIFNHFIEMNFNHNLVLSLKNFKKKVEISSKLYEKNDETIYKIHLELINKLDDLLNETFWIFFDDRFFVELRLALNNFYIAMRNEYNHKIILDIHKLEKVIIDLITHNKMNKLLKNEL